MKMYIFILTKQFQNKNTDLWGDHLKDCNWSLKSEWGAIPAPIPNISNIIKM